mgnify:CR=1 FL=1
MGDYMSEIRRKIEYNQGYYLPLFNMSGLKSSITPFFGGDLKLDQHHYALEPASELSLYANSMSRNVIFTVNQKQYFLNGQTESQQTDEVYLTTGQLYQIVERKNALFTLKTTSFIPVEDTLEVHQVKITNTSKQNLEFDVITAIPIYGRSADNIRDHRHVTSLLNRIYKVGSGVVVKPTLSFDERGHLKNNYVYSVFAHLDKIKVNRIITNMDDFIGGGSLAFPRGIYQKNLEVRQGYEAIGAIGFEPFILKPNESKNLSFTIGITKEENSNFEVQAHKYFDPIYFDQALNEVIAFFKKYPRSLNFEITNKETSELLEWVTLQPTLRRYFGNSYLPHHDYGRGGRGWRDLWQDILSLIMFNDQSVTDMLYNNFAGIRIDGSNATIIGDKPGQFVADRNKIVRVWSDHGAWPLVTTKMYIDETGDLSFLFKKHTYFDDQFTHYTKQNKTQIDANNILNLKNEPYKGTILEHLLVQNIVAFKNIGENGFVKLEDADWNDGLDMAKEKGETIAFTHFYANNLKQLANLIKATNEKIMMFEALKKLIFDEISLETYFNQVAIFNEDLVEVDRKSLIDALMKHYQNAIDHINQIAWITNSHLQSYINNDGLFSDHKETMSLTGQTMALLSETVSKKQADQIRLTTKKLLFEPSIGGYHLNSNYNQVLTNMGRAYGFAYNHKENGAIFSHMAIMYVYGLFNYDFVQDGYEGYMALINRALVNDSNVLHGIPEYFNDQGIGKYAYLTGSASWLLKLLRDKVFGITFNLGVLSLNPKLPKKAFIDHKASITTFIHGRLIKVIYINEKNLEYCDYQISKVISNKKDVTHNLKQALDVMEVYLDEV